MQLGSNSQCNRKITKKGSAVDLRENVSRKMSDQ